eukprot:419505-Amphidinium_carterae.1
MNNIWQNVVSWRQDKKCQRHDKRGKSPTFGQDKEDNVDVPRSRKRDKANNSTTLAKSKGKMACTKA